MRKVTIYGAGNLGVRVAFFLARNREISRIVLVDIAPERSRSTAQDFLQSNVALRSKIYVTPYDEPKEMGESDVVIVAAGVAERMDTELSVPADADAETMRTIAAQIGHFAPQALVAILSQPAEFFCRIIADTGYIAPERIVGFPLLMYREWYRNEVARVVGVGAGDVRITTVRTREGVELVGAQTRVGGVPLPLLVRDHADLVVRAEIADMSKRRKEHHYAPAAVVARVVGEMVGRRRQVITCMCVDRDSGAFPEAKAMVGPDGVEKVIPFDLQEDQKKRHAEYRKTIIELTSTM